jgi:hypothetical protein
MAMISNFELVLQSILDVHHLSTGYLYLWQRKTDGKDLWRVYRPADLFQGGLHGVEWETVNGLPIDLYYRQNSGSAPWWKTRKGVPPYKELVSVWVDLDPYHLKPPLSVKDALDGAMNVLNAAKLPPPNHIDFSGNGIDGGAYLRWLIDPLDNSDALDRYFDWKWWQEVMRDLATLLSPYGADHKSCDAGHWLRVPGSLNSKYLGTGNDGPSFRDRMHDRRIPLAALATSLNVTRPTWQERAEQTKAGRQIAPPSGKAKLSAPGYVRTALERLNTHRGGIREGCRNVALFLYTCLVRAEREKYLDKDAIAGQAKAFSRVFRPNLEEKPAEATIRSALSLPKIYKISFRTLIDALDITEEEQEALNIRASPQLLLPDGSLDPEAQAKKREIARLRQEKYRRSKGIATRKEANQRTGKKRSTERRSKIINYLLYLYDVRKIPRKDINRTAAKELSMSINTIKKNSLF